MNQNLKKIERGCGWGKVNLFDKETKFRTKRWRGVKLGGK